MLHLFPNIMRFSTIQGSKRIFHAKALFGRFLLQVLDNMEGIR